MAAPSLCSFQGSLCPRAHPAMRQAACGIGCVRRLQYTGQAGAVSRLWSGSWRVLLCCMWFSAKLFRYDIYIYIYNALWVHNALDLWTYTLLEYNALYSLDISTSGYKSIMDNNITIHIPTMLL